MEAEAAAKAARVPNPYLWPEQKPIRGPDYNPDAHEKDSESGDPESEPEPEPEPCTRTMS